MPRTDPFHNGTNDIQFLAVHVPTEPVYKILIHRKKNKFGRKPTPLAIDWEGMKGAKEYGQYYSQMKKVEIFDADGVLVCTYTKNQGWY